MSSDFSILLEGWENGSKIPAKFAFGKPGEDSPFAPSDNLNPAISWGNLPEGTQSLAIICHDPDVPSKPDDVNQEGKTVPADLPRVDFFHWVLVDIPVSLKGIEEGQVSNGIVAKGKSVGETAQGLTGFNDYTGWFAGDPDMEGAYGSYDGPCPPWNDSIPHHYHFTVYALSKASLGLSSSFSGSDALKAMEGYVLAQASHMGIYSMNPNVL